MLARKRKDFPIFGGGEDDECPVCLGVIVAIGFTKGICPSCAVKEIRALRRQIKRLTKHALDATPKKARRSKVSQASRQ